MAKQFTKQVDQQSVRTCAAKKRYQDKADASRTGQRVYHCKFCDGWHRFGSLVKLRNPVLPFNFTLD
jgi:hypothetical protein